MADDSNFLDSPLFQFLRERYRKTHNIVEIDMDSSGRPIFKDPATGTSYGTVNGAYQSARKAGLTSRYDMRAPKGSPMRQSGPRRKVWLEDLQSKVGDDIYVSMETWKIDASNVDDFLRAHTDSSGRFVGFPIIDDTIKIIGMTHAEKGKLSLEEIQELMNRHKIGFSMQGTGKGMKRVTGLVNDVKHQASFDHRLNTYVFDHSELANISSPTLRGMFSDLVAGQQSAFSDEAAKIANDIAQHALDGVVFFNPRQARSFVDQTIERELDTINELGIGPIGIPKARELESTLKRIRRLNPRSIEEATVLTNSIKALEDALELHGSLRKGRGVFNLRAYGLRLLGEGVEQDKDVPYSIKGNAFALDETTFKALAKELGIKDDIAFLTANLNVKPEGGLTGIGGSFYTMDPRRGNLGKPVFTDIDTLVTQRDIFSDRGLIDHVEARFGAFLKDLEEGRIPDGMRQSLERYMPDVLPGDPMAHALLQERMGWMSGLKMVEATGGDIRDSPMYMRQLMNSFMEEGYRKGAPRLAIPDAIRGEVMSQSAYNIKKNRHKAAARAGLIDVVEDDIVVMADTDAHRFFKAFGGFDLDDTLNLMLRWDEQQEKLKAIAFRQPTGLGEIGVFDVDANSELTQTILGQRTDDAAVRYVKRRSQILASIDQNERMMKRTKDLARVRVKEQREALSRNEGLIKSLQARIMADPTEGNEAYGLLARAHKNRQRIRARTVETSPEEIAVKMEALRGRKARLQADLVTLNGTLSDVVTRHSGTDKILARSVAWERIVEARNLELASRPEQTLLRSRGSQAKALERNEQLIQSLRDQMTVKGLSQEEWLALDDKLARARSVRTRMVSNEAGRVVDITGGGEATELYDRVLKSMGWTDADALTKGGVPSNIFRLDTDFMAEVERAAGEAARTVDYTSDVARANIKLVMETKGQLGAYTNARMLAASFAEDNFELMRSMDFGDDIIKYIEHEKAIDTTINLERLSENHTLQKMTDEMYRSIGKMMRLSTDPLYIDKALLDIKGKDYARSMIREGLNYAGEGLSPYRKGDAEWLDIDRFIKNEGRFSRISEAFETARGGIRDRFERFMGDKTLTKYVDDILFEQEDILEANKFLDVIQEEYRAAGAAAGVSDSFLDDAVNDVFRKFDDVDKFKSLMHQANRNILSYLSDWGDDPEKFLNRFGAAMQQSTKRGFGVQSAFSKSLAGFSNEVGTKQFVDMSYLTQWVQASFKGQQASRVGEAISDAQLGFIAEGQARIGAGEIGAAVRDSLFGEINPSIRNSLAAQARRGSENIQYLKSIGVDEVKRLWEMPGVKKGVAGLLAVTAASFLYQTRHGRSNEDMAGPEHLPGGSFYEQSPSFSPSYQTGYTDSGSLGTDYVVRVRGAQKTGPMMQQLSALTGGRVDATLYNRNNPNFDSSYSAIAGSY